MNADHTNHLVLVVEDNDDQRDTLMTLLELEGYSPVGAGNGEQALALLHHGLRPCLILLDLMMPVKDGWQFRAEQRQDDRLAQIPTVIVSAIYNEAPPEGVIASVPKPINVDALLRVMAQHC